MRKKCIIDENKQREKKRSVELRRINRGKKCSAKEYKQDEAIKRETRGREAGIRGDNKQQV